MKTTRVLLVIAVLLLAVPVLTQTTSDDGVQMAQSKLKLKPIVVGTGAGEPCATTGYFLRLRGVEGEATDSKHDKWIDVRSISMEAAPDFDGAMRRMRGTPDLGDIVVTKAVDKATPELMEAIARGRVFDDAVLELCQEGQQEPYLRYTMVNVIVSSYSVSGSAEGDTVPTEEFSLNYEAIRVEYTEHDSAGDARGTTEMEFDRADRS